MSTRRRKSFSRNWKSKSRRRRNVVEKSQSKSKTFDAIDVGHYIVTFSDYEHDIEYLVLLGLIVVADSHGP